MANLTDFIRRAKASTEFKTGFVKCNSIPIDDNTGDPLMTIEEWMDTWGEEQFMKLYRRGKTQIASETAIFNPI